MRFGLVSGYGGNRQTMQNERDVRSASPLGIRPAAIALLFARSVLTRNPDVVDIHVVNLGNLPARAAAWHVERGCCGLCQPDAIVRHLPDPLPPGCDLWIATVDRVRRDRGRLDIIIRWVQPGGAVDESLFSLGPIDDRTFAGTTAALEIC